MEKIKDSEMGSFFVGEFLEGCNMGWQVEKLLLFIFGQELRSWFLGWGGFQNVPPVCVAVCVVVGCGGWVVLSFCVAFFLCGGGVFLVVVVLSFLLWCCCCFLWCCWWCKKYFYLFYLFY